MRTLTQQIHDELLRIELSTKTTIAQQEGAGAVYALLWFCDPKSISKEDLDVLLTRILSMFKAMGLR